MKGKYLNQIIKADRMSERKRKAKEGVRYFKGDHDILGYRLFYYDENNQPVEDKTRSNIKIPHQFHTELVRQKSQYLLGNPIEFETEQEEAKEILEKIFREELQQELVKLVNMASNTGVAYLYYFIGADGKIKFKTLDTLGVIETTDEDGELVIIVYYDEVENKAGKSQTTTKAMVWGNKEVTYYKTNKNKQFELDTDYEINPSPHIVMEDNQSVFGKSFGRPPFIKLNNNEYNTTDLEPIKELIDDYDLMAGSLSNNLQDFQDAIYVVKGYDGDNLSTLVQNVKARKTVGVSDTGDVDIKTIQIPYEARKAKLELDKENIYKFGMGFDSSQTGDGNITNIVIKSRYTLLELKTNEIKTELKRVIREMLNVLATYDLPGIDVDEIDIIINEQVMINDKDIADNEETQARAIKTKLETILMASPYLTQETIIEQICQVLELDTTLEKARKTRPDGAMDIDDELFNQIKSLVEDEEE